MPELPEVETICRQLAQKIKNKKIKSVKVRLPKMVTGIKPRDFIKIAVGAKIKNVSRRAKLVIINLSSDFSLIIHLKLTGQLIYRLECKKDDIKNYSYIVYYFSDGSCLIHNDWRKFGYVKVIKTNDLDNFFIREGFGPEPLTKEFTLEKFKFLLTKKPRLKIKPLLMDQRFIAGIGNIYAQEACFCARIRPDRLVKSLLDEEIKNLYQCLLEILKMAIKHRGSSVDAYIDSEGRKGEFVPLLKVYDRLGKECYSCHNRIEKMVLGGRGTYFCPQCQK